MKKFFTIAIIFLFIVLSACTKKEEELAVKPPENVSQEVWELA
jgi:hypothetical protein